MSDIVQPADTVVWSVPVITKIQCRMLFCVIMKIMYTVYWNYQFIVVMARKLTSIFHPFLYCYRISDYH